jgi:hypothetical protein
MAALIGFIVYRAAQNKDSAVAHKKSGVPCLRRQRKLHRLLLKPLLGESRAESNARAPGAKPSEKNPSKQNSVRRIRPAKRGNNIAKSSANTDVAQPSTSANNAGDIQALTAMHFEKVELLLRRFPKCSQYESQAVQLTSTTNEKLAQQLIVRNMMLKREADAAGDIQVASLLESLEPLLLDIANLPQGAGADDVRVINDRVRT